MNIKRSVTAVLIIAIIICAIPAFSADTDEINNIVDEFHNKTRCENLSICVYDKGSIKYYGDNEGLYQIGSMTKAFTGLAVQKLICEEKLSDEDVITDLIPGFEAFYASEPAGITVKDLLEQKSGYTNDERKYPAAAEGMSLSDWAASISGRELCSKPGTEYAYSNVNFNLLGLIIENVSGKSYRAYMEEDILLPLGLDNTFVGTPSDKRIVEGSRLGYRAAFDYRIAVKEASIPAGYFYSNTKDMVRWLQIWTECADIPEDFIMPVENIRNSLNAEGDYYSGWERFGNDITGHSGGTPNYSSRIVFSEDNKTGVCVLTSLNVAATTDSLCNSIFDLVSGKEATGLSTDVWTVFDNIFTIVSLICIVHLLVMVFTRSKKLLIVSDIILIILLALILILFPVIFGAGLKAILLTWAPLSLAGGLILMAADIIITTIKIFTLKKHADNFKTGKRQTSDGNNRISRIQ